LVRLVFECRIYEKKLYSICVFDIIFISVFYFSRRNFCFYFLKSTQPQNKAEPSTSDGVMVRLRAGESFLMRELPWRLLGVAVRNKATTARASAGVHDTKKGSGSSHPPPPPPSRMPPEGAAAAGDVTVEETDALDCGVCFLPLKPPIFQVHTRTLLAHSRIDP